MRSRGMSPCLFGDHWGRGRSAALKSPMSPKGEVSGGEGRRHLGLLFSSLGVEPDENQAQQEASGRVLGHNDKQDKAHSPPEEQRLHKPLGITH